MTASIAPGRSRLSGSGDPRFRYSAGQHGCADPNRQVDKKDNPPAEAENIAPNHQTAEELTGNRGKSKRHAEQTEGACSTCFIVKDTQDCINLREKQRGAKALHDARGNKESGRRSEAAPAARQTQKLAMPSENIRRRPKMSPRRPPTTRLAPKESA